MSKSNALGCPKDGMKNRRSWAYDGAILVRQMGTIHDNSPWNSIGSARDEAVAP